MKISWRSVKWSLRYCDFRFAVLISGGHLGFWPEAKLDWFWLCPMREWSFGENFVMIGQMVSDILILSVLALISGRHLGLSAKPEVDCFFWYLIMPRSYGQNFMTITQTVLKILQFSFYDTFLWPPSWILVRTEIRWCFVASDDGMKLLWKFCDDRSNGLRYIDIWVFWRSFPPAIFDFPSNRKWIVSYVFY